MPDLQSMAIAGMKWSQDLLWVAAPEECLVATYDPATGQAEKKLTYAHEVWDISPGEEGIWMMTGGGRLGRQLVYLSLEEGMAARQFSCPDGAGSGVALYDGKLWVTHRHNRKLFCLDPKSGKVNWIFRTDNGIFSPAAWGSELWLIEVDPGPLGHWSDSRQGKYYFSHYDPVRERIVERIPVPFVPSCMAYDGKRFWYAEKGRTGFSSTEKDLGQL